MTDLPRRLALAWLLVGTAGLAVSTHYLELATMDRDPKAERQRRLEQQCRKLGEKLSGYMPHGVGFALAFYDLEEDGSVAYVSDGPREQVVSALKLLVLRLEGERS